MQINIKYIVFSFDDGLRVFYDNTLRILEKYGYKASLNIISGYSDGTVEGGYNCLTPSEIKDLSKKRFEIANHTNSHLKYAYYVELDLCNKKLNAWYKTEKVFGMVMPKHVRPSESAIRYIKEKRPPYVSFERQKYSLFRNIISRIF